MLRLPCCLGEVLTSNLEQGRRQQDRARVVAVSGDQQRLKINNAGSPSHHHTAHTTPLASLLTEQKQCYPQDTVEKYPKIKHVHCFEYGI